MLKNTFCHLPHIGRLTERRLWENEIFSWNDLLSEKNEFASRFENIKNLIRLSDKKIRQRNVRFFTDRLVTDQHWRIFQEFQRDIAYIDIETTGLGKERDHITTISLYDGNKIFYYVHGKNLNQFKNDIRKYKVLVTYNGKNFDVPFIEHHLGITLYQAHLDLRYILHSIGISGGLKRCEHQIGISRGDLEGVNGFFAVHLWKDYLKGNNKALETLIAYNIEDTINLEKLMLFAFDKKLKEIPKEIKSSLTTISPKTVIDPPLPFKPDIKTINRIKEKYY